MVCLDRVWWLPHFRSCWGGHVRKPSIHQVRYWEHCAIVRRNHGDCSLFSLFSLISNTFSLCFVCFRDRVFYNLGWPQTHDPPAWLLQMLFYSITSGQMPLCRTWRQYTYVLSLLAQSQQCEEIKIQIWWLMSVIPTLRGWGRRILVKTRPTTE